MQTIKTVNSLVAALTIKRIPESEIIQEIYNQTNRTVTTRWVPSINFSFDHKRRKGAKSLSGLITCLSYYTNSF